jgi:hypothetical protein
MEPKTNIVMDALTYTKDATGNGVQHAYSTDVNAAANMATLRPHGAASSSKPAGHEEEEEESEEEGEGGHVHHMQEHLEAMFSGESLSEEFMNKAATIFEAAVNERVNAMREQVLSEAAEVIKEEVESSVNELAERLDDYLGYVVEEWMEDNQLAVENGIRTEIAENFMTGLKELFETHYIQVPEEKYDVVDGLFEENEDLETQLNEQLQKNIELEKELTAYQAANIFAEVSDGLTDVEIEKFASLAEGVEAENFEQYKEKLNILKENYFNAAPTVSELVEETTNKQIVQDNGSAMGAYLNTLDRLAKTNKL